MITTYLIHLATGRDQDGTHWAIVSHEGSQKTTQYATEVLIDVPCRTFQDIKSTNKTKFFIKATGQLHWLPNQVARITSDQS